MEDRIISRELELREQLAELQSKMKETEKELQKLEQDKREKALRELFNVSVYNYVKIDLGRDFNCIGFVDKLVESECGVAVKLIDVVRTWNESMIQNGYNFEFKTIYTLYPEIAGSKDFKFQVITKDEYDSLVLNLLNKILVNSRISAKCGAVKGYCTV